MPCRGAYAASLQSVIVDNALYRNGERVDLGVDTHDLAGVRAKATGPDDFVWVGLHDPDGDELDAVADLYDLHELAVEDALSAHQRPKVERYADSLFIVLKTLWYVDEDDAVETGEISMFVGHKFVVTVRHGAGGGLKEARHRLEAASTVLAHGPSAVVYAVCDAIVDRYEEVAGVAAGGRRRGRGVGVLDRAHQRLGPHLHPQARAGRDAPRGDAAA